MEMNNTVSESWLRLLRTDYGRELNVEVLSIYGFIENELVSIKRYTSLNDAGVKLRKNEIFRDIVRAGVDTLAIIHNHPDGTLLESDSDRKLTENIEEFCGYMGVHFLGHYIVASEQLYRVNGDVSLLVNEFKIGGEVQPKGVMTYMMENRHDYTGKKVTSKDDITEIEFEGDVIYLGVNTESVVTIVTSSIEDLIGFGSPYYIKVCKKGCNRIEDDRLLTKVGFYKVLNISY